MDLPGWQYHYLRKLHLRRPVKMDVLRLHDMVSLAQNNQLLTGDKDFSFSLINRVLLSHSLENADDLKQDVYKRQFQHLDSTNQFFCFSCKHTATDDFQPPFTILLIHIFSPHYNSIYYNEFMWEMVEINIRNYHISQILFQYVTSAY